MTDIAGIDIARIEIRLAAPTVRLIAGSTTEQIITIANMTPLPDLFYLEFFGLPTDWISVEKKTVNLFPNWSDIVNLKVDVPAETSPGHYPLQITASSHTQENVTTSIILELVIEETQTGQVPALPTASVADSTAAEINPENLINPAQEPATGELTGPAFTANPVPEYPRLQVDLGFAQLVIPCGQAGEQIVHLLNLTSTHQVFNVGLEGLPPQWLTINPVTLNLSPNWSEAASIKIEVPGDAVPGRYLIGIKAVSGNYLEAVTWDQFDLVILPVAVPTSDPQPAASLPPTVEAQTITRNPVQPENVPVSEVPQTFETGPVFQAPQPEWHAPVMAPTETVIHEPGKEEPKQRSGFFGWKNKKKVEPVAPIITGPVQAVSQPELLEMPQTGPQDRGTNKLWPPATEIEPLATAPVGETIVETGPVTVEEFAAPTSDAEIPAPAPALEMPVEAVEAATVEVSENTVTLPVIEPEKPETTLEAAPVPASGLIETGLEEAPEVEVAEPPRPDPIIISTPSFELQLETDRFRFELGQNAEQKISLVNLLKTPALFELQIEGFPLEWYSFSYSQINLFPNWKEEVYFRVEAPPQTVPGLFTGKLIAFADSHPQERVEVSLEVEVLPSDHLYRVTGNGQPVKMPDTARILLELDKYNLVLVPGESLEQTVRLVNHSPMPDLFDLKLDGLPESWFQFSTPSLNLFPNWNEEFYLRIALPLNAVPGLYPVRVMVKAHSYPELQAEQSILLQVLPAPVVETPVSEIEPEAEAVHAAEPVAEPEPTGPAQPFSLASFFRQENLVTPAHLQAAPAPVQNPATAPDNAATLEPYNQPTTALPGFNTGTTAAPAPVTGDTVFQKRPTAKLSGGASLAGLIPVITPHVEEPASLPEPVELPPMPVAPPPKKRTLWQRFTGQGIQQEAAPSTPRIDESVLWRPVPGADSSQAQPSQNLWQNQTSAQPVAAPGYQPIGGAAQQPQSGQRAYSPISVAPVSAGAGEVARVQITLEKPHMTIVAGDSASQQIFMMNLTSLPDNFQLTIEGLPENWFSFANATLNLFPNWNEHTEVTINISDKVKPDLYRGRIVASALAQAGIKAVMPIEIEVLAPLVVQARLQPQRGKGFKADYELLLRNRSMSEGLMTLQWAASNEFSVAQFTPPQVMIAPGQMQTIKLQVQLRKKTPSDQARQAQPFHVLVQPQWTVAQQPVVTAPVTVEGEYNHQSRWVFIQRHPVLFTFLSILLAVVLLWNLVVLQFIQNTLLLITTDKVVYSQVASKVIMVDQRGFNQQITQANPLSVPFPTDVRFIELPQKDSKGVVEVRIQAFVLTRTLQGTMQVNQLSGDLVFVASNPQQLKSFPWLFLPPDKVVEKLNIKLKAWLKKQNPPQRLDDVYIEGNTLFLKIKNCQIGEVACK